jgi:hypothetical protein
VVWIMDQMAIWRARKGRRRLAGVHGVATQCGSSSNAAGDQECSAAKKECRVRFRRARFRRRNTTAGVQSWCAVQKTGQVQEDGEGTEAKPAAHTTQERESIPCAEGKPAAASAGKRVR